MKRIDLFVFVMLYGIVLVWNPAGDCTVSARVWHVCMDCEDRDVRTISEAIEKASPRDTILVYWEPKYPYYMEPLTIDKPLRIISYAAAGDIADYDYYPVITATGKEIIHIKVPGVELIGFNIMYLEKPEVRQADGDFTGRVGIRLSAPALIRYCVLTNCTTGILAEYQQPELETGSRIELCRIGLPADHGLNTEDLAQIWNYYGLVLLGLRQEGPLLGTVSDTITDCQVMGNSLYGLVYTPGNEPKMKQNTVELNGEAPFRIANPELNDRGYLQWLDLKTVETKKVDTKKVDTKKVDTKRADTKRADTKKPATEISPVPADKAK